jgi:hypothetical protein
MTNEICDDKPGLLDSASHLLSEVEWESKGHSVLALAAGVLVAVIIVLSKG